MKRSGEKKRQEAPLAGHTIPTSRKHGIVPGTSLSCLHEWYRQNARALPFRGTRDPYAILVSEIMLQQTRVAAMVPRYLEFMDRFPTVGDLAAADEETVLLAWKGLGYYSRARNLRRAAIIIQEAHGGVFPDTMSGALGLPGVGRYTAAAVLSIARGVPVAVVDGNVKRVLTRFLYPRKFATDAEFSAAAEAVRALGAPRDPGLHNQAVMELGAIVCVPSQPDCPLCPVRPWCGAYAQGGASFALGLTARKKIERVPLTIEAFIIRSGGALFLEKTDQRPILRGHWFFPTRIRAGSQVLFQSQGLPKKSGGLPRFPVIKHSITKYNVSIVPTVHSAHGCDTSQWKMVPDAALEEHLVTSAALKVLREIRAVNVVRDG